MLTCVCVIIILSCFTHVMNANPSSHPILFGIGTAWVKFSQLIKDAQEDFRYRKSTVEQYRDQLTLKLKSSYDQFKKDQILLSNYASNDIDLYLNQFQQIYNETISSLLLQKEAIKALENIKPVRPYQIDESLERFRTFYDETIGIKKEKDKDITSSYIKFPFPFDQINKNKNTFKKPSSSSSSSSLLKTRQHSLQKQFKLQTKKIIKQRDDLGDKVTEYIQLNKEKMSDIKFHQEIEKMKKQLSNQWSLILSQNYNILDPSSKISIAAGKEATLLSEQSIQTVISEFNHLQDEILSRANLLLKQSQESIAAAIAKDINIASTKQTIKLMNKNELLQEKINLEKKFQELEKVAQLWIDDKLSNLDTQIKTLQEKLAVTNSLYEELVIKKKAELEYSQSNDATLRKVLSLIDPQDEGWKFITKSEDGDTQVYRKFLSGPSSQYGCVMCNGTINSPPKRVLALLEDTNRIKEYNSFYESGRDVAVVADNTRIVYCNTPPIFPVKARDFVTVIHVRKLRDGTCVIINRATNHPAAPPPSGQFVRASIVLGAHIIQPIPGQPNKSRLTMLTQLNPGGFAPPVLVNHICSMGPIGFMQNVELAAKKTKI